MTVSGFRIPETGAVRANHIYATKWLGDMHRVIWMNDGSGLIALSESEFQTVGGVQIWFISQPDGAARRITNDLNSYGRVSLGLAGDDRTIVSTQSDPSMQIWSMGLNEPTSQAKQISNGKVDGVDGMAWTPDGRVVYVTKAADKSELWIMKADGSDNKQLTSDGYFKNEPAVSPDGQFIFFASMQSGVPHIWRINSDGSNPKQITSGDFADFGPTCAPDSQWITFVSARSGEPHLWRVGVEGGEAVQLTNHPSERARFSPDGKSFACAYFVGGESSPWKIAIFPTAGGEPTRLIDASRGKSLGIDAWAWAPDGRSLIYSRGGIGAVANLWSQPLDGGKPSQLTNFTTETIWGFSLAPDGKRLVLSRGHSTLDVVLIKDAR